MPQSKILLGIFIVAIFQICLGAKAKKEATYEKDENGIHLLTEQNFEEAIRDHDHMLVYFYGKNCNGCFKFSPQFAKAAQHLAGYGKKMPLAKVEVDESAALKKRFNIGKVPAIAFFKGFEKFEYSGALTKSSVVHWYLNFTGQLYQEVTCVKLDAEIQANHLVAAFFGDFASTKEVITQITKNELLVNKYAFYNVNDQDCKKSHGFTQSPALALFRKFDEQPLVYEGLWSADLIQKWMALEFRPAVAGFSEEHIDTIYDQRVPALILFVADKDSDKKFVSVFHEAAHQLKGDILHFVSGTQVREQRQLADLFGLADSQEPSVKILEPGLKQSLKYDYPGPLEEMTVDSLKQFVANYKAKKLPLFYKSQEIMSWDDSMLVKPVVGRNFKEKVLDNDKDVMILFYADNNEKSAEKLAAFENLSKSFANVEGLVFLKLNGQLNEVEGLDLNPGRVPFIYFYPGGKQSPQLYKTQPEVRYAKRWLDSRSVAYQHYLEAQMRTEL